MKIRKATLDDIDSLIKLYEHARQEMIKNNNPLQWGNTEPSTDKLISRIKDGNHYIVEKDGVFCGAFSAITGRDPTYTHIVGKWLNDNPYITIHTIASNNKEKGVLKAAIDFGFTLENTVRIDTHENNAIMKYLLEKYGFTYCGVIYLENSEPRHAYMKTK